MSTRTKCANPQCPNEPLVETANRNGGLCAPCARHGKNRFKTYAERHVHRGRPTYIPQLEQLPNGKYRQRFKGGFVFVGRVDGGKALGATEFEQGGTHHLLVTYPSNPHFSPDEVIVEFNDQGNSCSGNDVTLRLANDVLIVLYDEKATATTGRISYTDEADPFEEPKDSYCFSLGAVHIDLELTSKLRLTLHKQLLILKQNGIRVELPDS